MTNPCDWPVDLDCVDITGIPDDRWAACVEAATRMLWAQTGRRFGPCPRTVRPCRKVCGSLAGAYGLNGYGYGSGVLNPMIINGNWINMACGGSCTDDCSCIAAQSIDLPGPVDSVQAVYQDGTLLDPAKWKVYNGSRLVRTDGNGWPYCQRLDLPLTSPDTLGVAYKWGEPLPAGGATMTAILARELARACAGEECRLPGGVTQISRDGVTMTLDPTLLYGMGLTGLIEVDQWIGSVNPTRSRRPSLIRYPGDRRPSVQTYPAEILP